MSRDLFEFYVKEVWIVAGPTFFCYRFVVCFETPLGTIWLFGINSVFEEECVVIFLPNVWSKAKWKKGGFFVGVRSFRDYRWFRWQLLFWVR